MKELFILLISVAAFFGGYSQSQEEKVLFVPGIGTVTFTESIGNMNDYLDQVLQEATSKFGEFNIDPLKIPETKHTIQHKVWFVKLNGGVTISNGIVTGLKSLHRAGDATLQSDDDSQTMLLDGSLATRSLQINADVHAFYSFLKVNIRASGKVDYVRASIELELPLQGEEFKPRATYLIVNDINGFKLSISGLGPLNWLAEKIVGWYTGDIRNFINTKFARMALEAINKQLENISKPDFIP